MSAPPDDCLRFAFEGERVRRAAAVLERETPALETAIRRAVPFLGRRAVPISLAYARAVSASEVLRDLTRPFHAVPLAVEPGGGHGALVLDGGAVALLLDGVFGGDGTAVPTLKPAGLSAPQTALVNRMCESIVHALGEALAARTGVRIASVGGTPGEAVGTGAPVAYAVDIGSPRIGRIVLLLPKEALLAREEISTALPAPEFFNASVGGTLAGVDLELVVELARVPMRLSALLQLKVGDTLPLDVGVDSLVTVRANDRMLLRGHPTTAGGRIAVRIEGGHEG